MAEQDNQNKANPFLFASGNNKNLFSNISESQKSSLSNESQKKFPSYQQHKATSKAEDNQINSNQNLVFPMSMSTGTGLFGNKSETDSKLINTGNSLFGNNLSSDTSLFQKNVSGDQDKKEQLIKQNPSQESKDDLNQKEIIPNNFSSEKINPTVEIFKSASSDAINPEKKNIIFNTNTFKHNELNFNNNKTTITNSGNFNMDSLTKINTQEKPNEALSLFSNSKNQKQNLSNETSIDNKLDTDNTVKQTIINQPTKILFADNQKSPTFNVDNIKKAENTDNSQNVNSIFPKQNITLNNNLKIGEVNFGSLPKDNNITPVSTILPKQDGKQTLLSSEKNENTQIKFNFDNASSLNQNNSTKDKVDKETNLKTEPKIGNFNNLFGGVIKQNEPKTNTDLNNKTSKSESQNPPKVSVASNQNDKPISLIKPQTNNQLNTFDLFSKSEMKDKKVEYQTESKANNKEEIVTSDKEISKVSQKLEGVALDAIQKKSIEDLINNWKNNLDNQIDRFESSADKMKNFELMFQKNFESICTMYELINNLKEEGTRTLRNIDEISSEEDQIIEQLDIMEKSLDQYLEIANKNQVNSVLIERSEIYFTANEISKTVKEIEADIDEINYKIRESLPDINLENVNILTTSKISRENVPGDKTSLTSLLNSYYSSLRSVKLMEQILISTLTEVENDINLRKGDKEKNYINSLLIKNNLEK